MFHYSIIFRLDFNWFTDASWWCVFGLYAFLARTRVRLCNVKSSTSSFQTTSFVLFDLSFFRVNIKTNMAAYGLKYVRDSILHAYVEHFYIFHMLIDISCPIEFYPYWKFHSFDLDNFDEEQCLTEFRVTKNNLYRLADVLQIPMKITCCERTVASNIVVICIILKRLVCLCRFTHLFPIFRRNPTETNIMFNYVLDFIYSKHSQRFRTWNQTIM